MPVITFKKELVNPRLYPNWCLYRVKVQWRTYNFNVLVEVH